MLLLLLFVDSLLTNLDAAASVTNFYDAAAAAAVTNFYGAAAAAVTNFYDAAAAAAFQCNISRLCKFVV